MSVICAKKIEGKIVFAADSMISSGETKVADKMMKASKLFKQNDLVIGAAGRCYETTLMELFSRNHKPVASGRMAMIEFLMEFREWVKDKDSGYTLDNEFLIAFAGELYIVCGGLEVYEASEFESIGSGRDFANAALYLGHSPKAAVEVACKLSTYCAKDRSK